MATEIEISNETIEKALKKVDPELLKSSELGEKLKTARELTHQTNRGIAEMLNEKKRTFESWISGRYIPEGEKLKMVNSFLVGVGKMYINAVLANKKVNNIYTDFPIIFKLLDFNDGFSLLVATLTEKKLTVDYDSGKIS